MNSYYYEDKKEKIYYGEGTYEPEEQFKMAIHSLERLHDEKKPFALFLSVGVPHDPWTKDNVPAKYYDRYKDAPFTLPSNWSDVPDKYMDRNANPQKWVNYWKKNIPEMKRVMADVLQVDVEDISIKATTTEKLGFTGRQEGIAAYATVLIQK